MSFGAQTPSLHPPVAHGKPQRPQCFASVEKRASQPFSGVPSQLPKPGRQETSHTALTHADCFEPLWPQILPHSPQFFESVRTSTSQPSEATLLQSRR